ncbi:MAG: type II toxin-antitoxin system HicA family toxin [Saprospiraceae bacterium]|nr:type II toxin-antitoxin system HicA family toxin [Saprospiraceae bacterium]
MHFGFQKLRTKGSYSFYKNADGRFTTVPFHSNTMLPRPLIRSILRQINIEMDEYISFFKS